MGLCPSPDVAGDQFTGHREERRFLNRTNVAECLQRDHLYSLMPTIFLTLKRSLNVLHPTQRMFLSIQFSDLFPGGQGDTAHRRRRVKKYPRRRFRTCLFRRGSSFLHQAPVLLRATKSLIPAFRLGRRVWAVWTPGLPA